MEAELSSAFSYRQGSVRLVFKDMLACDVPVVLLPDLALPIWEMSSQQPPSGYLSITRSASGRSARDLRRQQAQGVPGVGKKADAVADRSGVPLLYNHACLHQGSPPTRRERRFAFPGSQVFGAGTLPVGFQGRSALVAPRGAKSRFKKLVHGVKYRKSVFSFLTGHGLSDILCSSSLSLL